MAPTIPPGNEVIAVLRLKAAGSWTQPYRVEVAKWLRQQAAALSVKGRGYPRSYVARKMRAK